MSIFKLQGSQKLLYLKGKKEQDIYNVKSCPNMAELLTMPFLHRHIYTYLIKDTFLLDSVVFKILINIQD